MKSFRHLVPALCISLTFSLPSLAAALNGAGSSAAAPLYNIWSQAYVKKSGEALDYKPVGSSGGIKQIKAREVDFGASDVAMNPADLKKEQLIQFPSAISGVVPIINVPGIRSGELKLTGELLAAIFSRKITMWNDAAITSLNPNVSLPSKNIEVIVRQDGSGTTYNYTDYLSKISPDWKAAYSKNFTIAWHKDLTQIKGSSGIVAALKKTPYAISYIDYNYVLQDKLSAVQLKNRDGKFLSASAESFAAALNASQWKTKASFDEMLTDKSGPNVWPITMGTFVIVPQASATPEKTIAVLKFFAWGFLNGDHLVNNVDLVRLPDAIQARVYKEMTTVTDKSGKPLQWSLQQ
ncbi:phosphate ABC transporter substrate-binding protein PstS [Undibacterium sp. Jales W-56]|uniref:phosphate ABC transporter substrate-binding protein PstS n=1 Tax=Undibacterium sp. Jales W-56 TaxID=2897325 RepID=UPI0021CF1944|nr:phosphate ABC transporter substrate-binding protein PstS [Undibacterium sp. Jales W-56]MCU6432864.1 phosphate ABC transporter substrate-binding protein PstS [Undibacterium sp. Jales W-56]